MQKHLNLVNPQEDFSEQRLFPRYPFSFLTFKTHVAKNANLNDKTFEVRNISKSGMQITLANGELPFQLHEVINGSIHWKGQHVSVKGTIQWIKESSLGVTFDSKTTNASELDSLLCVDKIVESIKPLHQEHFHLELPTSLKYWLKADGPFEAFIWQHQDGELSRFQLIMFDSIIEWEDGKGIHTGSIQNMITKQTPLTNEDIVEFTHDVSVNTERIELVSNIVSHLNEDIIPFNIKEFLKVKLGA